MSTTSLLPKNELHATILSDIHFSNTLGSHFSTLSSIGSLVAARPLGQAGVVIAPNLGNGNLFVKDHHFKIEDGLFNQSIGFVHNSQGKPQWRINIGRKLSKTSAKSIVITMDDGAKITFNSTDGSKFTATTVRGNFELTYHTDGTAKLVEAATGEISTFASNGLEQSRVDAGGVGIAFAYDAQQQLSTLTLPSKRSLRWESVTAGDSTTLNFGLFDAAGNKQQHFASYVLDASHALSKTKIMLNPKSIYEIDYSYTDQQLTSISQTDTTAVTFKYDTFQGRSVITDVNDGAHYNTHFTYAADKRSWQLGGDSDTAVAVSVDAKARPTSIKRNVYIYSADGTQKLSSETTNYAYNDVSSTLKQQSFAQGGIKTYEYDAKTGLATQVTSNQGAAQTIYYDQKTGNKVAVSTTACVEGITKTVTEYFIYDDNRLLRYHISAAGSVTQYEWDSRYQTSQ